MRNQILCIHPKFQPNRPIGTPLNKLCKIRGYWRPKWRVSLRVPQNLRYGMKIQIICDINSSRLVSRGLRDPVKTCHELGCFRSKSNIEVAIKSADLRLGKKYSGKIITSYGAFIHHILEQFRFPPWGKNVWYFKKLDVKTFLKF